MSKNNRKYKGILEIGAVYKVWNDQSFLARTSLRDGFGQYFVLEKNSIFTVLNSYKTSDPEMGAIFNTSGITIVNELFYDNLRLYLMYIESSQFNEVGCWFDKINLDD